MKKRSGAGYRQDPFSQDARVLFSLFSFQNVPTILSEAWQRLGTSGLKQKLNQSERNNSPTTA